MFVFELLLLVTILTPDLAATEQAYQDYFHYQTVNSGEVSPALANLWQQPKLDGNRYSIMQAASGKQTFLRFVENTKGVTLNSNEGWSAVEILVKDINQLADDISASNSKPSPFVIRGPPAWLSDKENVRAMQVTGPANEMLYLSEVKDPSKMLTSRQQADSYVDQTFIMVAGSRHFDHALNFYRDDLQLKPLGPFPYKIAVLAERLGLDTETLFDLALIKVTESFAIEMDRYPSKDSTGADSAGAATQLAASPILSITLVAQLTQPAQAQSNINSVKLPAFPYNNRPTLLMTGHAGEMIEVVISNSEPR